MPVSPAFAAPVSKTDPIWDSPLNTEDDLKSTTSEESHQRRSLPRRLEEGESFVLVERPLKSDLRDVARRRASS